MKIAWVLIFLVSFFAIMASSVSANLVTNPGFSGKTGWNFYTNGVASFTASGSGVVSITTKGSNTQLYQYGLALKPNTDYKLTFTASASKGSDLQVYIHKHGSPYTNYGLSNWNVPLTTSLQTFTKTFKTTSSASTDARLRFWLVNGLNGEIYKISNVILEETGGSTPAPDTLSVTHSPTSPLTGDEVTLNAVSSKSATIKIFVDDVLKKTCTATMSCSYSSTYTGTHTYYATAEASPLLRDPVSGTKSFTVSDIPPTPSGDGLVYREYYAIMRDRTKEWRVTDPLATYVGDPSNSPSTFLPNSILSINITDLSQAVKAEAIIDYWGGHVGTAGQKFRFNNNAWLTVPKLTSANSIPSGHNGECYAQQWNTVVSIPLSNLKVGKNIFEGTSGGQICHNFNWGQWGWYGMVLRIYYNNSKPHPTGQITSPAKSSTINENPTITVSASSLAGIDKVDVLAYYDGYDYDGDGIYKEYQENYRKIKGQNSIILKNHVGTDTLAPYNILWDTAWVPDQSSGAIKLKARIKDKNGVWFETSEVTGLTLSRSGSVKLYKAEAVPEKFVVRAGQTRSSQFTIPSTHNLGSATAARLYVSTWNGIDGEAEPGQTHYTKVNSWTAPTYGMNHFYSIDELSMPTSAVKTGTNTVTFNSLSIHHGIEILWPGPAVAVRYSSKQIP
ncbi:TPA: hypothetical protein HA235_06440 [Candidatus Woesearchaeota archaeon]|nr:hypothetical protein [Candidatus Woesearchaeota archaeon]